MRNLRRGANAIEFALTLPVFVALVMAIFEFGWMFFMRSTIIHAVRDGCRAGAVIPQTDVPSPESVATARMSDFMLSYDIDCRSGLGALWDRHHHVRGQPVSDHGLPAERGL